MPSSFQEIKDRIDNGLTVAHADVEHIFNVLMSGGSLKRAIDLQATLDLTNDKLSKVQADLAEANSAAVTLRDQMTAYAQERDAAVSQMNGANAAAAEAGAALTAKTAEFDALKTEHDAALAELTTAADQIAALDAKLADLQAQVNAANTPTEPPPAPTPEPTPAPAPTPEAPANP